MKSTITEVRLVAASMPLESACNMDLPDGSGSWLYRFMPNITPSPDLLTIRIVSGWMVSNYHKPDYESHQAETLPYCGYPEEGVALTMLHSTALALAAQ